MSVRAPWSVSSQSQRSFHTFLETSGSERQEPLLPASIHSLAACKYIKHFRRFAPFLLYKISISKKLTGSCKF